MANSTTKCLHPACECVVSKGGNYGKYCSEYCRKMGDRIELHCNCQHADCPDSHPVSRV
jgi:hypothetical protein